MVVRDARRGQTSVANCLAWQRLLAYFGGLSELSAQSSHSTLTITDCKTKHPRTNSRVLTSDYRILP